MVTYCITAPHDQSELIHIFKIMETKSSLTNLIEHLKDYISNKMRILVLKSSQKSFYILSSVISSAILSVFFLLFFVFLGIALALFVGEYFHHLYLGFLSVSFLYLIVFAVFYIYRKTWLEEKITDLFIKKFFMEEENND